MHLISKMHLTTDPSLPHGQGLGGTAFRSNEPCTSHDVTTDPRTRPWWAVAKKAGIIACAALPIRSVGAPVGVIYFFLGREHGALTDEIADLMDRMAENVSFALGCLSARTNGAWHLRSKKTFTACMWLSPPPMKRSCGPARG